MASIIYCYISNKKGSGKMKLNEKLVLVISGCYFFTIFSATIQQPAKMMYEKEYLKIVSCPGKCGVLTITPKMLPQNGSLIVISTIHGRIPSKLPEKFYEGNSYLGQSEIKKEGLKVLYDCADYGNAVHYRLYCQIKDAKGNVRKVNIKEWLNVKADLFPCAIAHKLALYEPLNMNHFMIERKS